MIRYDTERYYNVVDFLHGNYPCCVVNHILSFVRTPPFQRLLDNINFVLKLRYCRLCGEGMSVSSCSLESLYYSESALVHMGRGRSLTLERGSGLCHHHCLFSRERQKVQRYEDPWWKRLRCENVPSSILTREYRWSSESMNGCIFDHIIEGTEKKKLIVYYGSQSRAYLRFHLYPSCSFMSILKKYFQPLYLSDEQIHGDLSFHSMIFMEPRRNLIPLQLQTNLKLYSISYFLTHFGRSKKEEDNCGVPPSSITAFEDFLQSSSLNFADMHRFFPLLDLPKLRGAMTSSAEDEEECLTLQDMTSSPSKFSMYSRRVQHLFYDLFGGIPLNSPFTLFTYF